MRGTPLFYRSSANWLPGYRCIPPRTRTGRADHIFGKAASCADKDSGFPVTGGAAQPAAQGEQGPAEAPENYSVPFSSQSRTVSRLSALAVYSALISGLG